MQMQLAPTPLNFSTIGVRLRGGDQYRNQTPVALSMKGK